MQARGTAKLKGLFGERSRLKAYSCYYLWLETKLCDRSRGFAPPAPFPMGQSVHFELGLFSLDASWSSHKPTVLFAIPDHACLNRPSQEDNAKRITKYFVLCCALGVDGDNQPHDVDSQRPNGLRLSR